jgi:hypothetical protein
LRKRADKKKKLPVAIRQLLGGIAINYQSGVKQHEEGHAIL